MAPKGRGRPYGLMLLVAFAAAVVGVMTIHKLRELRILNLLLTHKDRDLHSLQLLLQRQRESSKESKRQIQEIKAKLVSLRTQKVEISNKLIEMQAIGASLKEEHRALESELDEKKNIIKTITGRENRPTEEHSQLAALTEMLKQKDAEIEELKRRVKNPQVIRFVIGDDPSDSVSDPLVSSNPIQNASADEDAVEGEKQGFISVHGGLKKFKNSADGKSLGVMRRKTAVVGEKRGVKKSSEGGESLRGKNAVEIKKDEEISEVRGARKPENSEGGKNLRVGDENAVQGEKQKQGAISEDEREKKPENSEEGESLRIGGENAMKGKKQEEIPGDRGLKQPEDSEAGERLKVGDGENTVEGKKHGEISEYGGLQKPQRYEDGENMKAGGGKKAVEDKAQRELSEDWQLKKPENSQNDEGLRVRGESKGKNTGKAKKHRKFHDEQLKRRKKYSQEGEHGVEGKVNGEVSVDGELNRSESSQRGEGLRMRGENGGKNTVESKNQSKDDGKTILGGKNQGKVSEEGQLQKPENSQDGENYMKEQNNGKIALEKEEVAGRKVIREGADITINDADVIARSDIKAVFEDVKEYGDLIAGNDTKHPKTAADAAMRDAEVVVHTETKEANAVVQEPGNLAAGNNMATARNGSDNSKDGEDIFEEPRTV